MLADNGVLRNLRLRHRRGIHLDLPLDVRRLPLSRKFGADLDLDQWK